MKTIRDDMVFGVKLTLVRSTEERVIGARGESVAHAHAMLVSDAKALRDELTGWLASETKKARRKSRGAK